MIAYLLVALHGYYLMRTLLYLWLWWTSSSFQYRFRKAEKRELPIYTVLAPMYREKRVVKQFLDNIAKLDYPKDRLQVIVLLEEDDVAVQWEVAIQTLLHEDLWIETIVCPPPAKGENKTKPRALNFALNQIAGEFVVVYDAEDEPEVDQLKKAVFVFDRTDYACLQACLNYRNHGENWLARMFSTEYTIWFDCLIPGLSKHDMPIPLGGTSNHFRTKIIRKLKGWDAKNVTEDCEIGLRMYEYGLRVGWLDSTTWEEACHRFWPWIKQRTRWIKGYMYTWVNTKFQASNWKALASWHLFVLGTPLVALVNPLMWALTILWLTGHDISYFFPHAWMWKFAWFCMLFGNILHIYMCAVASALRKRYLNALLSVTFPVYWLMMSIAGYRAFWQMFTDPTKWEKTEHGVSSRDDRRKK